MTTAAGERSTASAARMVLSVASSSSAGRVSLLNDVSRHCFNRRVARIKHRRRATAQRRRGEQHERRKRDDIITAHDLDAAAIRRAEQQMQRARDAVLRGDTYRIGGRRDAPTDRASDVERRQSREYIARKR
jgi:hypothetical protein